MSSTRQWTHYVRTVLDRAPKLSLGELRAVTRLLQVGGTHAAVTLERTQHAVPGADVAAAALRQVVSLAERLRDARPERSAPNGWTCSEPAVS